MTNSNRNPKELRNLIETCKSSAGDDALLDESFRNLRNISSEDKTEMGMLKSRIEEQSRLIMVYINSNNRFI